MKSIFHIQCSTPEDLRREFLNWLQTRAATTQDFAEHHARTKKDQLIAFSEARTYREIAAFWQEIIIDPKEEKITSDAQHYFLTKE